ncbi:hypothetical protein LTR95_006822 [Oleoguttula sp. CCFEE 5521]
MTAIGDSPMAGSAPPSKAAKLSERERNRENQRRLRERRKGYTQELEGRLQALEKKGIQATEVVQQAARTVVEENRALRQLLASKGISNAEVDEWVRGGSSSAVSNGEQIYEKIAISRYDPAVQAQSTPAPVPQIQDTRQSTRYSHSPHDSAISTQSATYSNPNIQPDLDAHVYVPPTPTEYPDPMAERYRSGGCGTSSGAGEETRKRNCDEMDCEEAARIITTLRGEEDPEAVWPSLGCSSAKRTTVKNSVLMSLAG